MKFVEYVEEQKKKKRLENIEEVRRDIHKNWVQTKIKNHIINFDGLFSQKEIEEKILTDNLVASKFCKDPSKTEY